MNIIIVLTPNRRAFDHFCRFNFLLENPNTRVVNPQTEDPLWGIEPCAIFEYDQWWIGKPESFQKYIDGLKKKFKMHSPKI